MQHHDYIMIQTPSAWKEFVRDSPKEFPCDYKLALILPQLWELGLRTLGCDQGDEDRAGYIAIHVD